MLSRVANNVYWMARYVERAENIARLVNVNGFLLLDLPEKVRFGWRPLILITGNDKHYKKGNSDYTERNVVKYLLGDEANPGSLLSSLRMARENARTVRDFVPRETWEQINELYMFARSNLPKGLTQSWRFNYLKGIILQCQTITGLLAGTMSHDQGYDFLKMGRNLERADMTTRIIDTCSANLLPELSEELKPFETIQWMSVLKSLSGYQMYRRQMQARVRRPDVLRFLFQERRFPRAFFHAVCEVQGCLEVLPRNESSLSVLRKIKHKVLTISPDSLSQDSLHEFIDDVQLSLAKLNEEVTKTYFSITQ